MAVPKVDGRSFKNLMPYLKQQYIAYNDRSFEIAKGILLSSIDWLNVNNLDLSQKSTSSSNDSEKEGDFKGLIKQISYNM